MKRFVEHYYNLVNDLSNSQKNIAFNSQQKFMNYIHLCILMSLAPPIRSGIMLFTKYCCIEFI